MKIVKEAREGVDVLTVTGKLDSTNASEFDARLREDVDEGSGRAVILDFAGVLTLTSAPLRAVLSLAKRMQRHGAMLLVAAPGENALESLRISGFLKLNIFELTDTLEAALGMARQAVRQPARPRTAAPLGSPLPGIPSLPAPLPPAPSTDSPAKEPAATAPTSAPSVPAPAKPAPVPEASPAAKAEPKAPLASTPPNEGPPSAPPLAPKPPEPKPTPKIVDPFALPQQSTRTSEPKPEPKPAPRQAPKAESAPISSPIATTPRAPESPEAPAETPAPREKGLIGWFNYWACEVQDALDYWLGAFRRK